MSTLKVDTWQDSNGTRTYGPVTAWISFDGTGPTIDDDLNVTSITDNGTGNYTINMTTALANANYAFSCWSRDVNDGGGSLSYVSAHQTDTKTTSAFQIRSLSDSGTVHDSPGIHAIVVGGV